MDLFSIGIQFGLLILGFVLLIATGCSRCWMTLEDFASVMHLVSQSSLTNSSEKETETGLYIYKT